MTTITNVTFTCNDKALSPDEKLLAIQNECQQTLYTDEEYDEAVYWKWISIFDTWMWVEDADERNNTSLDPLFLEDWIDVELLFTVRQLHNWLKEVDDIELENYERLDDVMSINHTNRNKQKFAVMKVSRDWNWIRKVIRNEEGNFEERTNEDDKPDWLVESEERTEAVEKANRETHAMKMLWKQIRDDRVKYKKLYNASDKLREVNPSRAAKLKKLWDAQYKDYIKWSKVMDELNIVNDKIDKERKTKEAENILHYFVQFQQCAPAHIIERLTRDDVKWYYKKYWYTATIHYLQKCIKRAEQLA